MSLAILGYIDSTRHKCLNKYKICVIAKDFWEDFVQDKIPIKLVVWQNFQITIWSRLLNFFNLFGAFFFSFKNFIKNIYRNLKLFFRLLNACFMLIKILW